MKKNLENHILGQEKATEKILKNVWWKLNHSNKILSLLLIGPSGVGKTETVKWISKSLNTNLIRLDMSEYNLETSVNRLIGVSAGYVGYTDQYIFRKVLDNPYSVILVDEIEKAHPRVLNLFLQILDEGFVTSAEGEKIDFTHTMLFMTSNAIQIESVGFIKEKNSSFEQNFSKEFLGRFTDIVPYCKMKSEILKEYIKKHLVNAKINQDTLIEEAECDKYGMRNLKNLISKYNNEIDIEIPL